MIGLTVGSGLERSWHWYKGQDLYRRDLNSCIIGRYFKIKMLISLKFCALLYAYFCMLCVFAQISTPS